jgi:transketolase
MNETSIIAVIFLTGIILIVQRSERRARRMAAIFAAAVFFLMRHAAIGQGDEGIAWRALAVALVLNALFWFLIGRYNPPKQQGEITVIGMDD